MAGCLLHICSAKSKASSEELGGAGRNKLINTLEQRQIGPVTPWLLAPHQQLRHFPHYTHARAHTSLRSGQRLLPTTPPCNCY